MVGAIIASVFGVLSLLGAVPVVLSVIGLGLGVNAIIKENKKAEKKKAVKIIAIIAIIANAFATLLFMLGLLIR